MGINGQAGGLTCHGCGQQHIALLAQAPTLWMNSTANEATTAFLSTYGDKIVGNHTAIIGEDVGTGMLQAFASAGYGYPIVAGDYTIGFLRECKAICETNPDFTFVSNCYPASTTRTYLHCAVLALNGYSLNPETTISRGGSSNTITAPMPMIVVKEKPNGDEPWLSTLKETTQVNGVDEILADAEAKGLTDNDCIDNYLSFQDVKDTYFIKEE